jgi:hypothetical protein
MPLVNEGSAEVEGESVRAVDDKEGACESSTMPNGGLGFNHAGTFDVLVIHIGQVFLRSESLGSSDSRYDLFCESSSFRDMLERYSVLIHVQVIVSREEKHLRHVLGSKFNYNNSSDGNAWKHQGQYQSKAP